MAYDDGFSDDEVNDILRGLNGGLDQDTADATGQSPSYQYGTPQFDASQFSDVAQPQQEQGIPDFSDQPDVLNFAGVNQPPAAPPAAPATPPPVPYEPLGAPTVGVKGARPELNTASQNAITAQTQAGNDKQQAAEQNVALTRDAYAKRRGELQAELDEKKEQDSAQQKKIDDYNQQLTEIAQEHDKAIDPNRYVSNMSGVGKMAALVSAGLHGYLDPHSQTLPIANMLQQQIDNDVQAQKADLQSAQQNRSNRLSVLERQTGSAEVAQARLKVEIASVQNKMVDQQAAELGNSVDQNNLAAMKSATEANLQNNALEFQKALSADRDKRAKATGGFDKLLKDHDARVKLAQSLDSEGKMSPEEIKKVTGVDPTLARTSGQLDKDKELEQQNKLAGERELAQNKLAGEREQAAEGRAETKATAKEQQDAKKSAEKLGKELAPTRDVETDIEQIVRRAGGSIDPQGNIVWPEDIPGKGALGAPGAAIANKLGMSTEGTGVRTAVKSLQQKYRHDLTGAAFSPQEAADYSDALDSFGEGAFKQKIEEVWERTQVNKQKIRQGYDDDAIQEYIGNTAREKKKPAGSPITR